MNQTYDSLLFSSIVTPEYFTAIMLLLLMYVTMRVLFPVDFFCSGVNKNSKLGYLAIHGTLYNFISTENISNKSIPRTQLTTTVNITSHVSNASVDEEVYKRAQGEI